MMRGTPTRHASSSRARRRRTASAAAGGAASAASGVVQAGFRVAAAAPVSPPDAEDGMPRARGGGAGLLTQQLRAGAVVPRRAYYGAYSDSDDDASTDEGEMLLELNGGAGAPGAAPLAGGVRDGSVLAAKCAGAAEAREASPPISIPYGRLHRKYVQSMQAARATLNQRLSAQLA